MPLKINGGFSKQFSCILQRSGRRDCERRVKIPRVAFQEPSPAERKRIRTGADIVKPTIIRQYDDLEEAEDYGESEEDMEHNVKGRDLSKYISIEDDSLPWYKQAKKEVTTEGLVGRFRCFVFNSGVEYLIAENENSEINLSDTYVYDNEAEVYARPITVGDIPKDFRLFRVLEWDTWVSSDEPNAIMEARTEIEKYYLVRQFHKKENDVRHDIDLFELYCLDQAKKSIEKCVVENKLRENALEPTLRISPYGIQVEDSQDIPSYQTMANLVGFQDWYNMQFDTVKRWEEQLETGPLFQDEPAMESNIPEFDEGLDDMPDIPNVDMS